MIKNYLLIAFRSFWNNKFYSLLNIFGLASGIATCLLIFLFVSHELSYDLFFDEKDKLFRVTSDATMGEEMNSIAISGSIVGPIALRELPQVQMFTRYTDVGYFRPNSVSWGEKVFMERSFSFADSTFFQMLSFPLLQGDPATVLKDKGSVVITESVAKKYFGSEDPVGKTLRVNNSRDLKITGVAADPPGNSHLQFAFVASFHTIVEEEEWFPMNYVTYLKLRDGSQSAEVAQGLNNIVQRDKAEQLAGSGMAIAFRLQPLTSIYMDRSLSFDIGDRGNKTNTVAFAIIGLFILLVACVNYINLTTARSEKRAREVGIRKVMGAVRLHLLAQFYGETLIITFLSVLVAVGITEWSLPAFSNLIGQSIAVNYLQDPAWLSVLAGLVFVITVVAGSYPAMYLSGFVPVKVLKGTFNSGKSGDIFRKGLVVFQFCISTVLILGTLTIYRQLNYANKKELGYQPKQVLVLSMPDRKMIEKLDVLAGELRQNANFGGVSRGSSMMGQIAATWSVYGEGMDPNKGIKGLGYSTDDQVLETLGIALAAGAGFNATSMQLPSKEHLLVNETMVRMLGWTPEEAVGKTLYLYGNESKGKIIGVVKDFHFNSLRSKIDPIFLFIEDGADKYAYVRVSNINDPAVMEHLRSTWTNLYPQAPFEVTYLDTELQRLYDSEQRQASILILFTLLSVVIGVLGLFGLTNYMIEKRTKEIGIRKVLGAGITGLVRLLSWDFLKLVLMANLLAWPVAWYLMDMWLADFAYHIELGWLPFVLTGLAVSLVAFLTVAWHSITTARMNPVRSLRYE